MAERTVRVPDTKEELLYRLARHLRNTDDMPLLSWGVVGADLLADLRQLDPAKYDRLVKRGPIPEPTPEQWEMSE